MRRRFLPAALLLPKMRFVRELARTEGQVHTGAADTRGVAALRGRDFAVGKVFWAEAACPIAASQPSGPDGSGDAGPGELDTCGCHSATVGGRGKDGSGCAIEHSCEERFAGAHGGDRE